MITFENVSLTEGHIARHTPTGSGAPGREAAIIDIAQDFLLSYLEDHGKMDKVSLKGGTAIRKFYAGREGRFSLDLDFSIDDQYTDSNELALEFVSEIDGLKIGPFSYSVSERRNKWYIGLSSPYNDGEIFRTKLDFASYPWLEPVKRSIIALPIHKQYGFELPPIHTVRREERFQIQIQLIFFFYIIQFNLPRPKNIGLSFSTIRKLYIKNIFSIRYVKLSLII